MTIETQSIRKPFGEMILQPEDRLSKTQVVDQYYDCCEAPTIVRNKGLYICTRCAVVHGPIMAHYLNYDRENNQIQASKNINHPPRLYGSRTVFSLENLPPKKRTLYRRLLKLNRYFHNSYEYNMTISNQALFQYASQLEIPSSIRRYGMQIYIKVVNKRLTVGRSIKNLTIASLYIACCLQNYSYNIEDFSRISQIPEKTIRKNYRLIMKELNIRVKRIPASQFISQFAIQLGLSENFQITAHKVLESVSKFGVNLNSNPKGFAAATLYFTAKKLIKEKRINQATLSKLTKISEVTLRKYIKIIQKNFEMN